MKKLLLSAMLLAGGIGFSNAQLSFIFDGVEVPSGSTVEFYEYETYPYGKNKTEIFIKPDLFLNSAKKGNVNINTSSNYDVQVCIGGLCEASQSVVKTNIPFEANVPQDMLIDCSIYVDNDQEIVVPEIKVQINASYSDGSSPVNLTLLMGSNAGVEGVTVDANKVVTSGKTLYYTVDKLSNLSVYSLSGRTVVNREVSGKGSISLENLPAGIYIYRIAGGKSGKFVIK